MLRPGTHHVRFLVDGQWRVADDLPAAVDDQGSLANYVAVPIPVVSTPAPAPPPPVTREKLVPGQSFWSADSSADGEYQYQPLRQQQQQTHPHATHPHSTHWTNILPPELIEAAREEEAYLSASAGQYEVSSSNTRVTTGFVPAPNIPPAPGLPRHLEKLILNTRVAVAANGNASGLGSGIRSGSGQGVGGVGSMGVGSGQGQAARKERRDRERDGDRERRDGDKRERDRDRERERGERAMRKRATAAAASAVLNIPPPPPPSEDGCTQMPETPLIGATAVESPDLTPTSTITPSSTSAPTISTNTNTAATSPQTSLPSTPIAPLSPITSKESGKENGTGPEVSPTMSPTRSPTTLYSTLASATASATNSATASPNPNTYSTTPTVTPPSTALIPPSHFSSTSGYPIPSGSRTITIDNTNVPSLSDDGSVLPVPSHVVLHHLSTSAIRNGVLAVGNTIRYRKKVSCSLCYTKVLTNLSLQYLTTIYYKPT